MRIGELRQSRRLQLGSVVGIFGHEGAININLQSEWLGQEDVKSDRFVLVVVEPEQSMVLWWRCKHGEVVHVIWTNLPVSVLLRFVRNATLVRLWTRRPGRAVIGGSPGLELAEDTVGWTSNCLPGHVAQPQIRTAVVAATKFRAALLCQPRIVDGDQRSIRLRGPQECTIHIRQSHLVCTIEVSGQPNLVVSDAGLADPHSRGGLHRWEPVDFGEQLRKRGVDVGGIVRETYGRPSTVVGSEMSKRDSIPMRL
mmetsp:Transcript_40854/g.95432  ORF Transcript_40854/g.95432 Transcript_40854/m.95432 type:complete len:254 (-) Transcript_40854:4574-5335(-)